MIEMPTLERCPHCKKPMAGELAYYGIENALGCYACIFQLNAKFLRAAKAGKITTHNFKGDWKEKAK